MKLSTKIHDLGVEIELLNKFQKEVDYMDVFHSVEYAMKKAGFIIKKVDDHLDGDLYAFKAYHPELYAFTPTITWETDDTMNYKPLVEWLYGWLPSLQKADS